MVQLKITSPGVRSSHTCELCGFEPKTKNKYREKQDHLVMKHFREKIDLVFPQRRPYVCPTEGCSYTGKDRQALLRHYAGKHGNLEKYLREALAEKGIAYVASEHATKRRATLARGVVQPVDPIDLLPKEPLPMSPVLLMDTRRLGAKKQSIIASPDSLDNISTLSSSSSSGHSEQELFEEGCLSRSLDTASGSHLSLPIEVLSVADLQLLSSVPELDLITSEDLDYLTTSPQSDFYPSSSSPLTSILFSPESPFVPAGTCTPLRSNTPDTSTEEFFDHMDISPELTLLLSNVSSASSSSTHSIISNTQVMWGTGPTVVMETSDTVPINFLETVDGNYATVLESIHSVVLCPTIMNADIADKQINYNAF